MTPRDRPVAPEEVERMLDMIEQLVDWLWVATFDEVDGEREVRDRGRALLERYRPAA